MVVCISNEDAGGSVVIHLVLLDQFNCTCLSSSLKMFHKTGKRIAEMLDPNLKDTIAFGDLQPIPKLKYILLF
jgi:hypothetical protein